MKYSLVICILLIMSCSDKTTDLIPPNLTASPVNTSEIALTVITDNIDADGVKYAELLFKVGPTVLAKYKEVNLDISPIGKFNNGATTQKLTIDVTGEAKIFAVSNVQGTATIKATAGDFSKQAVVHFLPAYPDQIFIEPDSTFLPAMPGAKTIVKARMTRASGQVSPGQTITFYDSTINNASAGIFLNTSLANASGIATTEYWLQDTSYHNYVYIKGYVLTNSGRVTGVNRIRIR